MEIRNIFQCEDRNDWIERIDQGDWRAAKFLAELLREERFHCVLGEGTVYLLTEGERLVSFVTLTRQDCIEDNSLYPWLGFFYTFGPYRGHRYGGQLLDFAARKAAEQGFQKVYLATDHVGLYEKYGFVYWQDRTDVYGETSRIYIRETNA